MKSIWHETVNIRQREPLKKDLKLDAVVIGGGLCGLLTAYQLQQQGLKTAVLEAGRIGSGMTGNTTAKITSQHGLIYDRLLSEFGKEKASLYAAANQEAVQAFREMIRKENISCHLEDKTAFVYSTLDASLIEKEVESATQCGIPAEFTTGVKLPFSVKGAVAFPNQAQFNPLDFLKAISEKITVYEHTKALEIEENIVKTEHATITADHIVMACHFPFINVPGYYFARMYQQRSYVIALSNAPQIDGMYIDASEDGYSFRNYDNFLLLGGGGHRSGQHEKGGSYEKLIRAAKELYPSALVTNKWSAQDCIPVDGVPYIGRFSSSTPHLFVATGFQKWGMSSSMAAARILTDMICKGSSPYEAVFSPQRFQISASGKELMKNSLKAAKGLIKSAFHIPSERLEALPKGHGGIVEYDGKKTGVYKNEDGETFLVSIRCPHLGCELAWNPDEKSWDCPCHGSRFDYKGNLLNGPAMKNLEYE